MSKIIKRLLGRVEHVESLIEDSIERTERLINFIKDNTDART